MGGTVHTIKAKTITELQKKADQWIAKSKRAGLIKIRQGWDPDMVVKTEDGYEIALWTHS